MDLPILFVKTVLLRPYVFVFLAAYLVIAPRLLGWKRTALFFVMTWVTAFVCEFSSTRTGIPFGWYHYTGSTVGQELYLSNVPFMDSLSFTFLLFASYCLALFFLLPSPLRQASPSKVPWLVLDPAARTSWAVLALSVLFFVLVDAVIDPVALRGDRWFLGRIYWYPDPGVHFGVPIANYLGWAVVGLIALPAYFFCDRRLEGPPDLPSSIAASPTTSGSLHSTATVPILLGCALYYGVLIFNLTVTFWINEPLIATTGILIYLPITAWFLLRLLGRLPSAPQATGEESLPPHDRP